MKREYWNVPRVHELVLEQGVVWSIEETEKRIKGLNESIAHSSSEDVCSYLLKNAETSIKDRFPLRFIVGDKLKSLCELALQKNHRNAYEEMTKFLEDTSLHNKLGVVYGLRNTGKTVILQQLAGHPDRIDKSAYISLKYRQCKIWELEEPISQLMSAGYKYFYIDEASWAEDFVDYSMGLADLFTPVKIIISGTDSLSLRLAANDALYHRVVFARTTWMPFEEYYHITGNSSILQYLEHGGVFWEDKTISDVTEYVKTSIVDNIYNTLRNIDRPDLGRDMLIDLTKAELYNIVYGISESIVMEKLYGKVSEHWGKKFAHGLKSSLSACKIRLEPLDYRGLVNDSYPYEAITSSYCRDKVALVVAYLQKLNFLTNVSYLPVLRKPSHSLEFTQSGVLQEFTRNVIEAVVKTHSLSIEEKALVIDKVKSHAEGGQLEAVVILTLQKHFSLHADSVEVSKVRHVAGDFEFDVVVNIAGGSLTLIEVKRTETTSMQDTRHLKNPVALSWVEEYFEKPPTNKIVLYRGKTQLPKESESDIYFINIEDFLLNIDLYLTDGYEENSKHKLQENRK